MRTTLLLAAACAAAACAPARSARAQDLAATCGATSRYDLTIAPDRLQFDRAAPAPRHVELGAGRLVVDGAEVRAGAEQRDRLLLFERELRALVPEVKRVARHGVDLAAAAAREEGARLGLGADTRAELERRLAVHAAELKRRIDASTSTRDWQGDALGRYADGIAADVAPLVAADLGQQAVSAAVGGDLDAAASLRDRATGLTGSGLRQRLERRLQALRPEILALCPSVRRLAELQRGVRGADGRALELVEIEPAAPAPPPRRSRPH
jgi:hypothetical protein